MKKIFAIIAVAVLLVMTGCKKNYLDTEPTDKVSGTSIFSDAENAMTAVNGLFRQMYVNAEGNWASENGGLPAYILVQDLKAEDHLMDGQGSGWFYYDYMYDTFGDYSGTAGHQYRIWFYFYKIICGANYILANEAVEGNQDYFHYAMGQAYAIRSFCYMWLIQTFQQNGGAAGSASRSLPGVPVYTEPTVAGSEGKGRGTVQEVYEQANADIDAAIEHLKQTSLEPLHPSHISLAAAYGLKARHALVQQDFDTALAAAKEAIKGQEIGTWEDIKTVNNNSKKNVMWGLAIQTDQATSYSVYDHMDADCGSTYSAARHLISNWLYDQIPDTDVRKAWWTAPLPNETDNEDAVVGVNKWGEAGKPGGSMRSWCQKKLVYIDPASSTGDHILMRAEEMYLIAAEAACEKGDYVSARDYLKAVGSKRDSDYDSRIARMSDSKRLNDNTVGPISTLMDEVFFQRRVELWGENPRLFDIQRRGLCFNRKWAGTNHTKTCEDFTSKPASANFILWIPQAEFDGNNNMDAKTDQNPGQGKGL